MNITIYKNNEGVYEFTGSRSDCQTINGLVDLTMTVNDFLGEVANTKTAEELEKEKRSEEDLAMKMAIAEVFEMVMSLSETTGE